MAVERVLSHPRLSHFAKNMEVSRKKALGNVLIDSKRYAGYLLLVLIMTFCNRRLNLGSHQAT